MVGCFSVSFTTVPTFLFQLQLRRRVFVGLDDRLLVINCPACCCSQQARHNRSCTTSSSRSFRTFGRPRLTFHPANPLITTLMLPVTLNLPFLQSWYSKLESYLLRHRLVQSSVDDAVRRSSSSTVLRNSQQIHVESLTRVTFWLRIATPNII